MRVLTDPNEYIRLKEWAEKTVQELGISGAEKLREATDKTIKESKAPHSRIGKIDIEKLEDVSFSLMRALNDRRFKTFMDDRLKKRNRERSSKGGQGHGKNPAVFEAIKYALAKSKIKTVGGLWKYLKGEFDKNERFITKDSDVFFEEETNVMTIRTYRKRGKTTEQMTDQTIKFSTFKTYVSAYKKKDR